MKIELSTFIAGMEVTLIADKHMLGITIFKGKDTLPSKNMSSLQRHYLKAEK